MQESHPVVVRIQRDVFGQDLATVGEATAVERSACERVLRASTGDAIQRHETGMDVLTSGVVPPNPAELLQSHAMADLLTDLRTRYDVIIIDAPPLLPVTDAALIAAQTDGALLVVRHGNTTRDQLHGAVERLAGVNARTLGVVLSMTPRKGGRGGLRVRLRVWLRLRP